MGYYYTVLAKLEDSGIYVPDTKYTEYVCEFHAAPAPVFVIMFNEEHTELENYYGPRNEQWLI